MIEILGVTLAAETLIAFGLALAIDEILPFLPTKYNGIAQAIVLGIKNSKLGKGNKAKQAQYDEILSRLEALESLSKAGQVLNDIQRGR